MAFSGGVHLEDIPEALDQLRVQIVLQCQRPHAAFHGLDGDETRRYPATSQLWDGMLAGAHLLDSHAGGRFFHGGRHHANEESQEHECPDHDEGHKVDDGGKRLCPWLRAVEVPGQATPAKQKMRDAGLVLRVWRITFPTGCARRCPRTGHSQRC
eukprot:scaffold1355_cov268-Pinguiococcus_pyrenoidosus.AAC.2